MALPHCASAKAGVISFPVLSLPLSGFTARRATSPLPARLLGAATVCGAEPPALSAPCRCVRGREPPALPGPVSLSSVLRPLPPRPVSQGRRLCCSPTPGLGVLFVLKEEAERNLLDRLFHGALTSPHITAYSVYIISGLYK